VSVTTTPGILLQLQLLPPHCVVLKPIEGLVRVGEQRQFLVVQRVIRVRQCVADRLSRHGMAGHRERGKGGRDDAAARGTGAVAPLFVPRLIGP
jgi:hypothetical protein